MALPVNGSAHLIPTYYSIYRPQKDERLSWPSWLTYSGWLTHNSGHPSAAGRAQDRESTPVRDRRSTTVPRHQLEVTVARRYGDSLDNTIEENSSVFSLPNLNALVAVSNGMRAVKLCTNRILEFLTVKR